MLNASGFGRKKEKRIANDQWTDGRVKSFIVSVLRAGSRKWPPKYQTLNDACVGVKTNVSTGRLAKHFTCRRCKQDFPQKMVEVDHINPVVGKGFESWDKFISNLFCGKDNLQVLCKECHKRKTKSEREK